VHRQSKYHGSRCCQDLKSGNQSFRIQSDRGQSPRKTAGERRGFRDGPREFPGHGGPGGTISREIAFEHAAAEFNGGKPLAEIPVVALEEVAQAGFFARLIDTVKLWFA